MVAANPIPNDTHYLGLTAIITVGMQLAFFAVAATFKFDKLTDFAGGSNFVVLAIVTFFLHATYTARQAVVFCLVCLWGIRLAVWLLIRILSMGKDDRFDDKRDDFFKFAAFWIFQMFWVWTVSLPSTFLQSTSANPKFGTAADICGIIMWVIGFVVEALADKQKTGYKKDESHRGHWCDSGLWKWSRHPNYFGEILLWWGVFTICSSVFADAGDNGEGKWGYVTILGPLFTTGILLFLSGIPLLEDKADKQHGSKADYREYKARTSVLIPIPPGIYASLPGILKRAFLFEWPMYDSTGLNKS